ncbi:MAG: InlB B-repeat-containing protein [Thermoprotei archaeon]
MSNEHDLLRKNGVSNIIAVMIMIIIITSLTAMYFTYRNTMLSTEVSAKESTQLENIRLREQLKIYINGSNIIIENIGSNPSYIDKIILVDNNDHVIQIVPIGKWLSEGSVYITPLLNNDSIAYLKVITGLGNSFTYFITKLVSVTISVTPTNGGITDPAPGSYLYPIGKNLTLYAKPAVGYHFEFWILNGQIIKLNTLTLKTTDNSSIIAVFSNTDNPTPLSNIIQTSTGSAPPAWLLSTSGTMSLVMYMSSPQNITPASTVLLVKAPSSGNVNVWIPSSSLPSNVLASITTKILPFTYGTNTGTIYPSITPILPPNLRTTQYYVIVRVVDPNGNGLSSYVVAKDSSGNIQTYNTYSNGYAYFWLSGPQFYEFIASANGYYTNIISAYIDHGDTSIPYSLTITLYPLSSYRSLAVKIVNYKNIPLYNTYVTVSFINNGSIIRSGYTNSSGHVIFFLPPNYSYNITAQLFSYNTFSANIYLNSNKFITLTLQPLTTTLTYQVPILYPLGGGYLNSSIYWSQYRWLYEGSNSVSVSMMSPGYANFTIVFYSKTTNVPTGDYWIPIYYSFQNITGTYVGKFYYYLHIDWGSSKYPNGAPLPIAMIVLRPNQVIDIPIFSAFQNKFGIQYYTQTYIIHPYASWGWQSFYDNRYDFIGSSLAVPSFYSPFDPTVNLLTLKLYYTNINQIPYNVPYIMRLQLQSPSKMGIYYYSFGYPVELWYSGPNSYPQIFSSLLFTQFTILVLNDTLPLPTTAADAIEELLASGASGVAISVTPPLSGFPFGYLGNQYQSPYSSNIVLTIISYGKTYLSNLDYEVYYTQGPLSYSTSGYWISSISQPRNIIGYMNIILTEITGSSSQYQLIYKIGPSLVPNKNQGGTIVIEWSIMDNSNNKIITKNVMG